MYVRLLRLLSFILFTVFSRWYAYLTFIFRFSLNRLSLLLAVSGTFLCSLHLYQSNLDYGFVFLKFLIVPLLIPVLGLKHKESTLFLAAIVIIILCSTCIFGFRGADQIGYGINSIYLGATLALGLYDKLEDKQYVFSAIIISAILLNGSGTSIVMLVIVLILWTGVKSIPLVLLLIPFGLVILGARGRSLSSVEDWDRVILSVSYIESLRVVNPFRLIFTGLGQEGMDAWSVSLKRTMLYDYVLAENGVVKENMLHNDILRLTNSFGLLWTVLYWSRLFRVFGRKAVILLAGSVINPILTVNIIVYSLFFIRKK